MRTLWIGCAAVFCAAIAPAAGDRPAALAKMQEVMGPLAPGQPTPPDVQVLEERREPAYTLRKITYAAEKGDRVPAWLFIPHRRGARLPAVVCLHQTTRIGKDEPAGLGGKPNLHYARELAARGYVTLAPDYPNFGDYRFDPYAAGYASASMKGIRNHMRGVDLLAGMAEVDATRIAAIGHSLGGHNALFLAAFDERVRAAVTSCGFTSFARYKGGDLTGWSHNGYMPRIASVYGKSPARMPFDFSDVLTAIAPRAVFINAPLGDDNFDVTGVRETVAAVGRLFPAGRLETAYPDAAHDFPPAVREQAYAFLDRQLEAPVAGLVVALGDSVTFGVRRDGSVGEPQTFSAVLEQKLKAAQPAARVINAGVGGNDTGQMLARLERDVIAKRPRLVLVMAGLNDAAYVGRDGKEQREARVPLATYTENLRRIVRLVRASGADVVLLTPNPMTAKYVWAGITYYRVHGINAAVARYAAAVRSVARETGAPLVDLYDVWTRTPGYEAWLPDGIHPDAEGHRRIADLIFAEIAPLLRP